MASLLLLLVVGVVDPFAPTPAAAEQQNREGWKHLRHRELAAARPCFERALALAPDFDGARYNLATTLAAEARWHEALEALAPALLHNHPRYRSQVLDDPDWAPLKAAPERAELRAVLDRTRAEYAMGLGDALVMVARLRPALASANGLDVRSFRHQELFAWDRTSGRFRQLTETAGRVVALARSPDHKRLAYLVSERTRLADGGAAATLSDARVFELELATLDTVERAALPAGTREVAFGFGGGRLQIAHARGEGPLEKPALDGESVWVSPGGFFVRPPPGPPVPLRPPVPIDPDSLTWSPDGTHALVRARQTPCQLLAAPGTLYRLELGPRRLVRVARLFAHFDPLWLDAQAFAFDDGLGEKGGVEVVEGGKPRLLRSPHGLGLHGLSEPPDCPRPSAPAGPARPPSRRKRNGS
jgi:hypothetical protein